MPVVPHERLTFEALYERYYDYVYRRAFFLMRSPDDAEDITQEAFFKAFHAWEKVQEPCNYKAWLYRIVTNAAYDVLRRRQCKTFLSLDAIFDTPDHFQALDVQCEQRETLHAALAHLTPEQRQAVLLLLQGYELRQVAAHMRRIPGAMSPSHMFVKRACDAFIQHYQQERQSYG